jgi:SAM-dependent methyltransferase
MSPGDAKPACWATPRAAAFEDQSVVDRYHLRPPYPQEAIDLLVELAGESPGPVLDVGTGTGEIARRLVGHVERVDAVDRSPSMLARAQALPGGADPRLRWILGTVEDVALAPPYTLITGGSSLHWLEWNVAFARFAELLGPRGVVAIVRRHAAPDGWREPLRAVLQSFEPDRSPRPDLVAELQQRGLFREVGRRELGPFPFEQSIDDFVGAMHSRSAFSLERMQQQISAGMDEAVREVVEPFSSAGALRLQLYANVVWGRPFAPGAEDSDD